MAQSTIEQTDREQMIIRIREIQDALVTLKVKRESFNPAKMSDWELEEELDAYELQLQRRKEVLGVE